MRPRDPVRRPPERSGDIRDVNGQSNGSVGQRSAETASSNPWRRRVDGQTVSPRKSSRCASSSRRGPRRSRPPLPGRRRRTQLQPNSVLMTIASSRASLRLRWLDEDGAESVVRGSIFDAEEDLGALTPGAFPAEPESSGRSGLSGRTNQGGHGAGHAGEDGTASSRSPGPALPGESPAACFVRDDADTIP